MSTIITANNNKNFSCGPLTFLGDFDSANLLKAELVYPSPSQSIVSFPRAGSVSNSNVQPAALENTDYEVNVWTRPDCHNTQYANGNRTWFYFGVRGNTIRRIMSKFMSIS